MAEMASRYQPKDIEANNYKQWEEAGYFAPSGKGEAYSIMIPPPNVTGTLHMGHAFQDTIMDILIRYNRMNGKNTLWQVGSDHAGIATQMVVERRLNAQGKTRHDLGRDDFLKAVWDWKAHSGGVIMQQLRRLGASVDWSRERFTMDEKMSKAVRQLFVKLYDEGLIYRGKRLVNWDPVLKTAISDLEVVSEEEDGFLYQIRYPYANGEGFVEVATTRPETMLGDTAVAVNPKDERYTSLIGKTLKLPLTDREIPVIADDYVDMEFGTGCVKITPAHDFNDYQVGVRHNLEQINIFNPDASLNENAPKKYQGLSAEKAREIIVKDLQELGLMVEIKPHKLMRPRGDRTGVVIEPYLTDQWFVDFSNKGYECLTKPAIEAVKTGKIRFVPKNWENTYFHWLENLQDWCISRQLWWGHRIPAWYDENGNIYVAENESEVRTKYGLAADLKLKQDEDVLDTWFSSALWPFSTQGWPEKTADLATYYPSSVLITGFDIIFFWIARMVLMGLYCMDGAVPFRDVYIHGLVRDGEGNKMSKSKGNIIDPIDVIDGIDLESLLEKRTENMMQPQKAEKIKAQTRKEFPNGIPACGTDALRFYFAALATSGRDVIFDISRVEGYRNFCNKIWNAARFALMQTEGKEIKRPEKITNAADLWILERLDNTVKAVQEAITTYRFDFCANAIYEFIWGDFCDWYLELLKPVLSKDNPNEEEKAHTRWILLSVLEKTLRLAHPVIPFITEEIWQQVAKILGLSEKSIMMTAYPQPENLSNPQAMEQIAWLQEMLLGIRKIKADMDISPAKSLKIYLQNPSAKDLECLNNLEISLKKLGKLESISTTGETIKDTASFVLGNMTVLISLEGLIDKTAELARLEKEIAKLEKNITKLSAQLRNPKFLEKAPEALVNQTKDILNKDQESLGILQKQVKKLS